MRRAAVAMLLAVVAGCVEPKPYRPDDEIDAGADADAPPTSARDLCQEGVKVPASHGACAAAVCAAHPDCCAVAWNHTCVQAVELETAACARSCSQALFIAHNGGTYIGPTDGALWGPIELPTGDTYAVSVADDDGDGDLDLGYVTVSGWGAFRRDGASYLPAGSEALTMFVGRHLGWADWDGDGDVDLAIGGLAENDLSLVRNDGGTLVTVSPPLLTSEHVLALDWGDVDGDGDPDLVAGSYSGNNHVHIFRNDGGGQFTANHLTAAVIGNEGIRLCQLAGDRRPELVSSGNGFVRVYLNTGGNFATTPLFAIDMYDRTEAHCGDFDRDGDLDIAISGWSGGPLGIYRNDAGTFSTTPTFGTTTAQTWSMDVGDVDGDHRLDLVLQPSGTGAQVFLNTTVGQAITFAAPTTLPAPGADRRGIDLGPRP